VHNSFFSIKLIEALQDLEGILVKTVSSVVASTGKEGKHRFWSKNGMTWLPKDRG